MPFTETELEYMSSQRLGRLATAQPNGTLQVNPVGFRYNGETDTVDITGYRMSASRKFRNVATNGQAAFVIDDLASIQPWRPRMLEIRGRAEAITDPVDSAYGGAAPGGSDGAIIRIHPKRVISFGINPETTPGQRRSRDFTSS